MENLRQRKRNQPEVDSTGNEVEKPNPETSTSRSFGSTFWLARIVFLRGLAAIYFVAFFISFRQSKQLIGDNGLLPLKNYLTKMNERFDVRERRRFVDKFQELPTLLWILEPWNEVDWALDIISLSGLAVSTLIFVSGAANSIALIVLWIFYHSIVQVGQSWYSFGWESQLLETGFLAIWIVPFLDWKPLPPDHPPPWIGVVFYRWLITRIMLGAGLIKIRGDRCWIDLTCMNYFYETQPNPNPAAFYLHQMPESWHSFETFGNHVVELILPLFAIIPLRIAGMINGFFQILFQLILISTGNLSFLNWLTIMPSIWFFDDKFFSSFFTTATLLKVYDVEERRKTNLKSTFQSRLYRGVHVVVALLISYLSYPIVLNLLNSKQVMNTSYEPFRIVNTYGAFGHVTKNRTEVILEGTWDSNPRHPDAVWLEYDFHCKPGDITQRPCLISPYHYRLDWLMWFAAFQRYEMNPWLIHLAGKMLQNDVDLLDVLVASNPFRSGPPPRYVRASHYAYTFTKLGSVEAIAGQWWTRSYIGQYMPPLSLESIGPLYDYFGWDHELD